MTRVMRAEGTCRTDATGPACRRGETRGAWRVARFAVVAVMAMVLGMAGFVTSAEAAISHVTSSSAGPANSTTLTIGAPTGVQLNDVMIAYVTTFVQEDVTAPAGWTRIYNTNFSTQSRFSLYWKRATASEPGSYNFTHPTSTAHAGGIALFRGVVETGSPIEAQSATVRTTNASNTVTANGITTLTDGAMVVMAVGLGNDRNIASWTTTSPGTLVESFDVLDGGTGNTAAALAYAVKATAGATGNGVAQQTTGNTENSAAALIALKPQPTCSESTPSSMIWNGTNTAANDFNGSSFVTSTDIVNLGREYKITQGSGTPPAFTTYTENFATGNNFGSWVATDTDATAGKDWLTLNGQTPSGTNTVGPTVDQSGSGFFAYTESTGGTNPTTFYLASPSIDNATYATSLDFYWNKNHNNATYCELYVDASSNNGTTWDNLAIWNPTPPTASSANSTTWTRQTVDLSGITPTGGQDNIKVRFRTITGGFECDTGIDTVTIDGTPRSVETTVIDWTTDPIPAVANLTDGNTYNIYSRGADTECGTMYYGDSVAQTVAEGTPQIFTWSSCSESIPSSIIWNGVTTAAGDFNGSSLATLNNVSGVQYQVSHTGGGFGDCSVTNGRQAFPTSATSFTVPVTIADPSQAFLLVDIAGGALETAAQDHMATGYIQDASTLRFDRVGTAGSNAWVSYQLVECTGNLIDVQRGQITLNAGTASGTGALGTAVTTADSIVLVSTRSTDTTTSQDMALVAASLQDANNVVVSRQNTTGTATARYEVIEFQPASGATVQTGTFAFDSTAAASQTRTITAVDPSRSWLTASWDATVDGLSQTTVGLELTNATTITAYRYATVAATNNIRYYVVEFPAGEVTVNRGAFNEGAVDPNAGDNVEGIVNIPVPAVSAVTKAFTTTTNTTQGTGTAFPRSNWLEQLTSPTNLRISNWRTNNTNSLGMHYWQVMEFTSGGGEVIDIPWTSDPVLASATLTDGDYTIYARGTDPECGIVYYGAATAVTVPDGTPKTITWSSCNEQATLSINNPGTIGVPTPITLTLGGSGGSNPQWSADGGTTWYNSGTSYTPPSCASGSVTFTARATGTCGTVSATPLNGSYDSTDTGPAGDLATITVSPSGTVNGLVNIEAAIGVEATPASMGNVVLNVTGTTACNLSNGVMTWNAGASRWQYLNWDTSACGNPIENGVSLTVSGNDPDCNDFVQGSSTVSINNTCSDPGSTVSWTPPGGTVDTPIVVSATLTGSATSPQVSFDNGVSWLPNGSTYTPKAGFTGTSDIMVRALNSCTNLIYGGPYTINFDGRTNNVKPVRVQAVATSATSMRVSTDYSNDKNNNAEFTLSYKVSTDTVWTPVGPVVDGQAGDNDASLDGSVRFILNGLTADTTYDLELYVTDADGIDSSTLVMTQATPWTGAITLTSWTDNAMLHNALRFACSEIGFADEASCIGAGGTWNLGRKWANGWGLPGADYPGAEYDAFDCSTCHMKNSSNVKRLITAVTAKTGSLPGTTVDLQTVVEGSSNFGDDSDAHTTSNKACEVCHSKTQYHRYDTSAQINLNHNNNTDCIRCHEHKVGFRASCDSCHGTPPVSAQGLVTTDPTGSTIWGEHQKHAVEFGFDCNTCHTGWDGTGMMPNGGNLNIGFGADVNPRFAGAVNNVNGGTYEGRPAANGSYTANAGTGTTVTQDTVAADMSCAVYCHGYGTPIWNPTSTVACGSCHGKVGSGVGDRSGAPTGVSGSMDLSGATTGFKVGKHATHIDDSIFQTGDPCALCHDGFGYSNSTHVNGTVNVNLNQGTQSLTPTTTGGAGASAVFTPGGVGAGTCSNMDCHGDTPWDSASQLSCTAACHGYPPTSTAGYSNYTLFDFVSHNTPNGFQYLKDNHGQCKYCHGWNDDGDGFLPITGMTAAEITAMQGDPVWVPRFSQFDSTTNPNGLHGNGTITMNADSDANGANDSGYNPTNGGCDNAVCHGNDVAHRFILNGSTNTVVNSDIGPGDCGACHTTGVGGATIVTPTSPHTKVTKTGSFTSCGACHSGHYTSAGGVQIPNNLAVGISYTGTQHGGIKLGGPGTDASISGKTTEAEICWACHALAANNISEWGNNAKQATTPASPVPTQYNYGTLSSNAASSGGWYSVTTPGSEAGATWTSGKTSFAYKTGAIQSTHSVNNAGTSTVTATPYQRVEALDKVADIRCSYCHDVHDAVGPNGAPYLRGTWWGNPYEEDGAPQSGQAYVNLAEYGAVPRGGQNSTNLAERLGGFWIDANNVQPGTALTTVDGTAYRNPTATGGSGTGGAWTFSDMAGLCILCHTNNVSTLDWKTGEGLWLGTANGHSNSVVGGAGGGTNIFNLRGGNTGNQTVPAMHFQGAAEPGDSGGFGFRNGTKSNWNYTPCINACSSESTLPYAVNLWGSLTIDANTVNANYHKFSCSKCHNPHASRLPKLMITNCLDTKHNTWDDTYQLSAVTGMNSMSLSNWTSAQNCHRLGGIIPSNRVIPNGTGTYPEAVDTGAVAAPMGTGTDYKNRGWNNVTPW